MTTRKRDLRTGRPIWLDRRMKPVPTVRLKRDIRTEILIIGAGISGALLAEALAGDHRVAVIDRRGPVKGSTPASTALVQYEIDVPLTQLQKSIGWDHAARAWQRARIAVDALVARTEMLGIECDTRPRHSLYLSGDAMNATALEDESSARRAAGIETTYLTRSEVTARFGITGRAALVSYGNVVLDPRRLAAGYLRAACDTGRVQVFAPVEATELETGRAGVTIKTAEGPVITADHVVYCTGYELPKELRTSRHHIISTYALATAPQPRRLWPERCTIWEAAEPYLYLRDTPDGRVICGGEDEEISDAEKRDRLLPAKIKAIREKLSRLFPALDTEPTHAWAGTFGTTATGLPSIGRVPGKKNVWAVLGFGGNGITYARIAADIIRAELSGRSDPDAGLYAFGSKRG